MIFRLFILIILLTVTITIHGRETEEIDNSVERPTMKKVKADPKSYKPDKNPDVEQIEITPKSSETASTQLVSPKTTTIIPVTTFNS